MKSDTSISSWCMPTAIAIAFGAGLAGCGDRTEISADKLIGVWRADVSMPRRPLFVYETNHTYEMRFDAVAGAVKGRWSLDGNLLITTLDSFRDPKKGTIPTESAGITNKVLKLTDTELVLGLRKVPGSTKFRRVK